MKINDLAGHSSRVRAIRGTPWSSNAITASPIWEYRNSSNARTAHRVDRATLVDYLSSSHLTGSNKLPCFTIPVFTIKVLGGLIQNHRVRLNRLAIWLWMLTFHFACLGWWDIPSLTIFPLKRYTWFLSPSYQLLYDTILTPGFNFFFFKTCACENVIDF